MKAVAVSPAKIILFGEHFVVGGNSAISMTIDLPTVVAATPVAGDAVRVDSEDLKVQALFSPDGNVRSVTGRDAESLLKPVFEAVNYTLRKMSKTGSGIGISVKSDVPIGMGLGSSAAAAVGVVSAVTTLMGKQWSKDDIFDAAYSLEKLVHGHPSGVDQATVTYGGLVRYRQGRVDAAFSPAKAPNVVVGSTRKRRSTGQFVGQVTNLRKDKPEEYGKIAARAQAICDRAVQALRVGDIRSLGSLMKENQSLLELIGVSSAELEKLIEAALSAGALGAKLTGGGGGGCMIALVEGASSKKVVKQIQEAGGEVVASMFTPRGVECHLEE